MKKLNKELLYKTLKDRLDEDMRWGRVGGAHLLVLQNGEEVASICQGWHNPDTGEKLRQDAIYRACVEVLANAVSAFGEEETLRRMNSAMHNKNH